MAAVGNRGTGGPWESAEMVRTYTDIDADESISMYFKDGDISIPEKKGLKDI